MRGLLLLLPVILVIIILAGSGQAEEEVAEQRVEGLSLEEKAEVALERDAREAVKKEGTNKEREEKKTKLKKRQRRLRKRKGAKKSKKTIKTKSNKEGPKKKGGKSNRKKNPKRNKPKEKKKKKLTNKQKRQKKKAGNRKNKAKGSTKKKKKGSNRKGDNGKKKRQRKKKKTPGKKVKKTKRKRKGSKKQQRKSTKSGKQGGPPVWSDWSSCGKTSVNDSCILNAVSALNFEKNQIQTFLKQKARLLNQNKTTGNKLGKKGEFTDAAGYLLIALGGNLSTAACGERESSNATKTSTNTRAMNVAVDTYNTLINCSVSIKAGCSMPDQHINQTFLDECEIVYKKSKAFSEDCRGNKTYTADGSLACLCWEKAAYGIVVAKEKGCTTASTKSAKAVKKQKQACIKAFSVCKKAEDAAIALVHTCMAGEINTVAAKSEGRFLGY